MNTPTPQPADIVEACAVELTAAHRAGRAIAPSAVFQGLSMPAALQVQRRVLSLLDETFTVSKLGINADGIGVSAPIFSRSCGTSGHVFALPQSGFLGIEVEIAARLSADITPDLAAAGLEAILSAIASFHVGVELVGSRLADREAAGAMAQLADNINTCGYIHNEAPFPKGADLSGAQVEVTIDGQPLDLAPAVSAFGNILNPILACGKIEGRAVDTLKAGTLVTTGALSGLIPIHGPAKVRAGIAGFDPVEFRLER